MLRKVMPAVEASTSEGTCQGLRFEDVTLTYRTRRGTHQALGPLTLNCEDGEFVAVLGPSGCGKSTLLKLASGLLASTSGSVHLHGKRVSGPRNDIGMVFQQPTLLPWKTVEENVLMPLKVLRTYRSSDREKAARLLDMVGLSKFAKNYPFELSGGMQQRVGIARGLIHEPLLLLMDEPFAALDALTREQMTMELQSIWQNTKKSVLFITHSIPEAVILADRVVVLSAGPGRIIHEEKISIPRPRDLSSMATAEFVNTCNRLRQLFVH
jgi:NitT/TauT family transport system ATP-binding protein